MKNFKQNTPLPFASLLLIAAVSAIACQLLLKIPYQPRVRVDVIDVGQGSSALITCYGDSPTAEPVQVLIDAGESNEYYEEAEYLFQTGLRQALRGDREIEYAIATHPHRDHIFGFKWLLHASNIAVQRFIDNAADIPDQWHEEEIRQRVSRQGISYTDLSRQALSNITLCRIEDQEVKLLLAAPQSGSSKLNCPADFNNCSIVAQLNVGSNKILFMADATLERETELLANPPFELQSNVLVAGHHGHHSSSRDFLQQVNPSQVIISTGQPEVGTNLRLCYPEAATIERIFAHLARRDSTHRDLQSSSSPSCNFILACHKSGDTRRWDPFTCPRGFYSTAISGSVALSITTQSVKISTLADEFVTHIQGGWE